MTNVDELIGVELARAVAERRGWEEHDLFPDGWWDGERTWFTFEDHVHVKQSKIYRPDRDITQAWELDGEGWEWRFQEHTDEYIDGGYVDARILIDSGDEIGHIRHYGGAIIADFPSKAHAYATARCRAYLKATEPTQ